MGNFYINHTVCTPDMPAVVQQLAGSEVFVSRERNECFVVFDKSWEGGQPAIEQVGKKLSSVTGTRVLTVIIADDDIMNYWLFKDGEIDDTYDSDPSYESVAGSLSPPRGGDAVKLCAAFGCENSQTVEKVLRTYGGTAGYLYETDRHKALVELLKLPQEAIATGFDHLKAGEFPKGFGSSDFELISR